MTPVCQEFYARYKGEEPGPGVEGDCFRAALASLLDLPLSAVPHFLKEAEGDKIYFWQLVQSWLAGRGQAMILTRGMMFSHFAYAGMAPVFHLIVGEDEDGDGHTLVGLNGKVVWDPNPSMPELISQPSDLVFCFVVNTAASAKEPQA